MKKVIHVQTAFLTQALAAAAIGNGKGFVLMVIPSMMQGEETVQGALLGSSDGERMGRCVFEITCTGFEKSETYYPTKSLMKVAATLAKVTDRIEIEVKESYLELSAEDGTSRVKVPLNTTDLMFDVPDEESKTAVFFNMKTDDFAKVIHCGAFPTLKAEQQFRAVYFSIKENSFATVSYCNSCMAKAELHAVEVANPSTEEKWHTVDDAFIRAVVSNLRGEMIRISLTDKYIVITDSEGAFYASKKLITKISMGLLKQLEPGEEEYSATCQKKALLLGIEVAIVGLEDAGCVRIQTNDDGTVKISSKLGENSMDVIQTDHEGNMEESCLGVETFRNVLQSAGETIRYHGMNSGSQKSLIHFEGSDGNVSFHSIIIKIKGVKKESDS